MVGARTLVPRARSWAPDIVVHEPSEVAGAVTAAASGALHVMHGLGPTPPGIEQLIRLLASYPEERLGPPSLGDQMLAATQLDICPPGLSRSVARVLDEPSFARGARTLQDETAAMPSADETLEELIGLRSKSTALVGR